MAFSYQDFVKSFINVQRNTPSYRVGQHWCNMIQTSEEDEQVLWELSGDEAYMKIFDIIECYQLDLDSLPLRKSSDAKAIHKLSSMINEANSSKFVYNSTDYSEFPDGITIYAGKEITNEN